MWAPRADIKEMPTKSRAILAWCFSLSLLSFSGVLHAAADSSHGLKPTKCGHRPEAHSDSQAARAGSLTPKVQPCGGTTATTIPLGVVPVEVTLATTVFDPITASVCAGDISAANGFNQSPLVQVAPMTFNGVSMGTTQYLSACPRAEFRNTIGGSAACQNTLSPVTTAATLTVKAGSNGIGYSSGSTQLGLVSCAWLNTYEKGRR